MSRLCYTNIEQSGKLLSFPFSILFPHENSFSYAYSFFPNWYLKKKWGFRDPKIVFGRQAMNIKKNFTAEPCP